MFESSLPGNAVKHFWLQHRPLPVTTVLLQISLHRRSHHRTYRVALSLARAGLAIIYISVAEAISISYRQDQFSKQFSDMTQGS